jgi:polyisoprenoid-binding protein YceI
MHHFRRFVVLAVLAACAQSCATVGAPAPTSSTPGGVPASAATAEPGSSPEASGLAAFQIDPSSSEARFVIDEVLNGSPNTVVGATSQVSGEIRADPEDPSRSVVGPISIDAGSLTTDNGFRNQALSRFILQTNDFPTITFTSTAIDGLPSPAAQGQAYTFTLTGDLTIRDATRPVTFQVSLTVESADRLTGSATATVHRSDFDLSIPSVPQVAEVSDDVILQFDFTAVRAG